MSPKYKLTYFPIKGLAEPIRFLLAYMGEDFEDFRFNRGDWINIKMTMPWGKCPILEVDGGERVAQSMAICRYLGRKAGLAGADDWEDLRIDEILGVIDDMRADLAKYNYEPDAKRKEELREPLLQKVVPYYMKKLDDHIRDGGGFLANKKLSWADIYFAAVLDYFSYMNTSDLTEGHANVRALRDRVYAMPRIKAWIDKRPESEF